MISSYALAKAGYGYVEVLDRRAPRQKSRYGGHELLCHSSLGTLPMKSAVKVLGDPIRLRHLDEMGGVIDRTQSDLGIVLSPHPLSGGALVHRHAHRKSRIEVIDGPLLAELCARAGVGVSRGHVDYDFFESLASISPRVLTFIKENQHG
jgi:hypothetical protein